MSDRNIRQRDRMDKNYIEERMKEIETISKNAARMLEPCFKLVEGIHDPEYLALLSQLCSELIKEHEKRMSD